MHQADTAIILAGGKSSRMGFDKEQLLINDKRLVDVLSAVLQEEFSQVIVVSNNRDLRTLAGVQIVSDELSGVGPLGGIHAGLKVARSMYSYLTACDMPNLNMEYVSYLRRRLASERGEISVLATAFGNHIEPFNAFYNGGLVTSIEEYCLSGRAGLADFLRLNAVTLIDEATAREFSPDWSMFANLNTPEEHGRYQKTGQ